MNAGGRARGIFGPWLAWATGVTCLLLIATGWSWPAVPFLPGTITVGVTFPTGIPGRVEPLLCTGSFGAADFLVINYLGENTATFSYDSWGVGGPTSAPFEFTPGATHSLRIEMPALADVRGARPRALRPLRITMDGRAVLTSVVRFHPRAASHIYFGGNPIGGNTSGALFRGTLVAENGRALREGPHCLFPWRERVAYWAKTQPWQVLITALASLLIAILVRPLIAWCATRPLANVPPLTLAVRLKPPHPWFAASALVCLLGFSALVTNGTFQFLFEESFGNFYDHQAASLLHGRLDVPREAPGGETFVVDGKYYGYFGITPALLRLPVVAAGVGFGKLSRLYLVGYYAACLVAAYLLLIHATRLIGGRAAWPSGWAAILFTVATGLGSTLFFLGTRAYVYHEAILCGAAFALWTTWCALRYLAAPESRWWIGALACGALAVHARPSSGLFALCVVGCVALAHVRALRKTGPLNLARRHVAIGLLAVLAVLSFNGMSYLKFGTFDGSPLRYSVQYTPERVARFESKNFHLSNIPRNIDTYVLQPDFELRPSFPYFFVLADQWRTYAGSRMDIPEPTLAIPFAMPALFVLALGGCGRAWWWVPRLRRPIGVLAAALVPMAFALFAAVVTSHRYTGDFCPFLIACAALGLAVIDGETSAWRGRFQAMLTTLALISVLITGAISLHFQGYVVWGVPDEVKQSYDHLRRRANTLLGLPTP